MLRVDLAVSRGGFAVRADFEAPAGAVSVLFGPSGSGKSTLLQGIAGLLPATGAVRVGTRSWQEHGRRRLPPHRRRLGFVFQDARLLPHLDVAGELAFVARRRDTAEQVAEIVERLALDPLLRRRTTDLSGGERQRVALARALLCAPEVLLLDEPLSSLDRPTRRQILPWLEEVAREAEVPVLYVTHSLSELCRLGDYVLPVAAGRVGARLALDQALLALALPATAGDPVAVLRGSVARRDDDGLAALAVGAHQLLVADRGDPVGSAQRLLVRARDVSVALDRPERTSILNVLPATVEAIAARDGAEVVVTLGCGGQRLLALISRRSSAALGLAPGARVFAQVKAAALA